MDFLSRHRNKLIGLSIFAGVSIGAYYYIKSVVSDGINQVHNQIVDLQRKVADRSLKENEINRLKDECSRSILSFIKPLHKQISKITDPREITERLKEFRDKRGKEADARLDEEMEKLWTQLKVVSISRLISSIYALAILDVMLRVQQYVIGRFVVEEITEESKLRTDNSKKNGENNGNINEQELPPSNLAPKKFTSQMRERYMIRSTEYFISHSIPKLIDWVNKGVEKATEQWKVGSPLTRSNIIDLILSIRSEIEGHDLKSILELTQDGTAKEKEKKLFQLNQKTHEIILGFIIQPDDIINNGENGLKEDEIDREQIELLKRMINESMDVLETPYFAVALEDGLNVVFDGVIADLKTHPFEPRKQASEGAPEEFVLAKVLVGMKSIAKDVLASNEEEVAGGNHYVRELENLQSMDLLARVIFGVDSQSNSDLGLGDLGLGEEEMKMVTQLLGATGGSSTNGAPDLQALLGSLGGAAIPSASASTSSSPRLG